MSVSFTCHHHQHYPRHSLVSLTAALYESKDRALVPLAKEGDESVKWNWSVPVKFASTSATAAAGMSSSSSSTTASATSNTAVRLTLRRHRWRHRSTTSLSPLAAAAVRSRARGGVCAEGCYTRLTQRLAVEALSCCSFVPVAVCAEGNSGVDGHFSKLFQFGSLSQPALTHGETKVRDERGTATSTHT